MATNSFVFSGNLAGNEHNVEFNDIREVLAYADKLKADPKSDLRDYRIEWAAPAAGYYVIEQEANIQQTSPAKSSRSKK